MLNLKKLAVTGGLSCGKSSACHFLKILGAYVVSADEIVNQLLSPGSALEKKVIDLIGSDIVVNGKIDKAKVAKKVFDNPKLLRKLERLLHPEVLKEIKNLYKQVKEQHSFSLFAAEIPLLFEAGLDGFFDYTAAVVADAEICKKRFEKSGKQDYEARARMQMSPKEKAEKADFVIFNNGTKASLKKAIKTLYETIQKL